MKDERIFSGLEVDLAVAVLIQGDLTRVRSSGGAMSINSREEPWVP